MTRASSALSRLRRRPGAAAVAATLASALTLGGAVAQDAPQEPWPAGLETPAEASPPSETPADTAPAIKPSLENTTIVPRTTPDAGDDGDPDVARVRLVAQLTADGQYIDQGVIWRVYEGSGDGKAKLIGTHRDASPTLKLKPGSYYVNAAFGRAHLTRQITVKAGGSAPAVEPFVLNAGGLRVTAVVGGKAAPGNSVSYSIYSDRDQSDNRKLVLGAVKPGLIIRLNAGIYHVVSTYGDANAVVRNDVTVEAGKLTEATISHAAAKATFKLVNRAGGDAVPDTHWTIQSAGGESIKESVGALPTHILAPGSYTVIANSQGKLFQRAFSVTDGEITQVEVVTK